MIPTLRLLVLLLVGAALFAAASFSPRLTVPAGRVIRFDGTSLDVIHDFWIPRLKYQHQVFPAHDESWDLTFPKPGVYPGLCAWFCGLYHQNMHFDVVAVPAQQFAAWLDRQKAKA